MVKLYASLASIIAAGLGTGTPAAVGYSHLHPPLIRHDFFPFANGLTERSAHADGRHPLRRHIQGGEGEVDDDCPGTPILWKIVQNATGEHVGFGVGTMHLPYDVVLTEASWNSTRSAIEDSCHVYGELNLFDANVSAAFAECTSSIVADSATLEDVPDDGLRDEIKAALLEFILANVDSDPDTAATLASGLEDLPLNDIIGLIQKGNTQEFMERDDETISSNPLMNSLDGAILALGRPAGSLEEVSTQCKILPSVYTTAEELNTTIIRNAINTNYSMIIQLYRCGDINSIADNISMFLEGISMDEMDFILNDRNKQMAAKIAQLLDNEGLAAGTSSNKKMLFAVGLTHWIAGGDDSLESMVTAWYISQSGIRIKRMIIPTNTAM